MEGTTMYWRQSPTPYIRPIRTRARATARKVHLARRPQLPKLQRLQFRAPQPVQAVRCQTSTAELDGGILRHQYWRRKGKGSDGWR